MSDPSVRIEPPNILDQQSNYTSRLSRIKKGKDIDRLPLHLLPSHPLRIPSDVARNPRGQDIHREREED